MTETPTLPIGVEPLFRKINCPTPSALFFWTVADKQGGFIGKRRTVTCTRVSAKASTKRTRGIDLDPAVRD
jgi:hypothetical protein